MMQRRPLVMVACCWVIGIHLGASLSSFAALVASFALAALLPICVLMSWCNAKRALLYGAALLLAAGSFVVYDRMNTSIWAMTTEEIDRSYNGIWSGTIISPVERDGDRVQFRLRVGAWKLLDEGNSKKKQRNIKGGEDGVVEHIAEIENSDEIENSEETVLVNVRLSKQAELSTAGQWRRGNKVSIAGQLERPQPAWNFGAFDYRNYLRTQHIFWILKVKGASSVQVLDAQGGSYVQLTLAQMDTFRAYLSGTLARLFAEPHSGYLQGLILGLQNDLDPETYRHFSQLGLTHVLAISGMHVAVFVGTLLVIFRLFRLSRETSLIIIMWLIPLYVLLTGAAASIVRAGIMSVVALYGLRRGWLRDGLHLLAGALLVMLWWEPYYAMDVGFQLSFAVTAGLILGVPRMQRLLPHNWPLWLTSSVSVTVVAQVVSLPLTVFYFHQVSQLSVLANFVLVPFISLVVLPLGTIALMIGLVYEPVAKPFVWIVQWMNDVTFATVQKLAHIEGATVIWPQTSAAWIAGYFGTVALLTHFLLQWRERTQLARLPTDRDETQPLPDFEQLNFVPRRGTVMAVCGSVLLLLGVLWWGYRGQTAAYGSVSVLDVGQGDSILVRTAAGRHLLIDGGGTVSFRKPGEQWRERKDPFEIGRKQLVPLLKQRGVRELDAVILTHGDADHAGGLRAVMQSLPTRKFIMNGTWKSSPLMNELYEIAINRDIPIVKWQAGDMWAIDDTAHIEVLYPAISINAGQTGTPRTSESSPSSEHSPVIVPVAEQNEASLVLRLTLSEAKFNNEASFLLTGDIGASGERDIVQEQQQLGRSEQRRQIDVLKVAHHGSRTSTTAEWLEYWSPRFGVISAGRQNIYGHPHPLVMSALRNHQVSVLRTDRYGEVEFRLTSRGLEVRTRRGSDVKQ
ncbi:ComEC/Rec2 family competence protein [Paenibacillus sp. 481]|uniref:ComEC/Rec2 family competence protein n=1 Tax=Paenibacillus sp. 481 TaxID=2835869 RepID=UPI001E40898C|nr:ComEC/Rec2 family competence protein [Paenibacillus sp. 481]UHA74219.1 ComEC/Rec2 family competence protein [Paenibacillus sp. 481]